MAPMGRPGVTITEVLSPRDTGFTSNMNTRAVLLSDLTRGPVTPTVVASWAEYRSVYGDWMDNPPLSADHVRNASVDSAYLFFANAPAGGAQLTVLRVANADAAPAHGAITDATNQSVLNVTAISPGEWGNRMRVTLSGQYGSSGAFSPTDYASTDFRTPTSYGTGQGELLIELLNNSTGIYDQVERFTALSMDALNRRYIELVVNGISRYVTVDVGAGVLDTAESKQIMLSSGSNGNIPADLNDTLQQLDFYTEPLTVTYAGHWNIGDLGTVASYCTTRGESFMILDTPDFGPGVTPVADWVSDLNQKSPYSAVYYPPVVMNDPSAGPSNVRRTVPCGGAVLGAYMANDVQVGVWKTPAGVSSALRGIVTPAYRFTNAQLDEMNTLANPINPIRVVTGVGPCLMGGKTLNQAYADRYIGVRRSFSFVKERLRSLTEFALFEVNGPDLWEEITIRLNNFLGLYFQQGALRGARESQAYYVICNETNNTTSTIAAGEVHIEVGIAVEYPAEFIIIKLTHNQTTVRVD